MKIKAIQRFIALYSIVKSRSFNRQIKSHLYKLQICSILQYVARAWDYAAKSAMNKLKVIQNKIIISIYDGDRYT
jgi:hypothetical protein